MKQKFISLGLALALLLSASGCAMSAPASVGSIGGVAIPAGVYLLSQYNAYSTVSGLADLATGETANDVDAVLKAQATGTIGDEEVTAAGADYVDRLTRRTIEHYAAVESKFAELGGELSDTVMQQVNDTVDSLWESNGDLYEANGIGKESARAYLTNTAKAGAIVDLIYGPEGTEPVSDDELKAYLEDECLYIDCVQIPLMDYSTYAFADEDQTAEIEALAEECAEWLTTHPAGEDELGSFAAAYESVQAAAKEYVPKVMEVLGGTVDADEAAGYAGSMLYLSDDVAGYDTAEGNTLKDPLDAAGEGKWTTINMGMGILVVRKVDPLTYYTLDETKAMYDLVGALKADDVDAQFYVDGAALEHKLDENAIKTYKAANIKRTV